jgi:hypothetical protein
LSSAPVHDEGLDPISQPANSHPPQQRAGRHVDRGQVQPPVGSLYDEHIGDPGQPATSKIDDLGI